MITKASITTASLSYVKPGQWIRRPYQNSFQKVGRNDGSQIIFTDFSTSKITEDNRWDPVEVLELEGDA